MLENKGKEDPLEELKKLQDEGIETLIKVVEIKSDEEQDEATQAKGEYAKAHFERVIKKLSTLNLADIDSKYRGDVKQYYTFDLLTTHHHFNYTNKRYFLYISAARDKIISLSLEAILASSIET